MADDDEEVWFHKQLARLTPGRMRHLLRLGEAWDQFSTQMQHRLTEMEAGRGSKDGADDAEQWLQQWQAANWRALYIAMGAPPQAVAAAERLLVGFEHRRAGIHDSLFAPTPGGATRPTVDELRFRSYVVHAALAWRASGTGNRRRPLDDAFDFIAGKVAWIAGDEAIRARVGGVPTVGAIRGWYEDRKCDTRLGRFYTAVRTALPPELAGAELAQWLITAISSREGKAFAQ